MRQKSGLGNILNRFLFKSIFPRKNMVLPAFSISFPAQYPLGLARPIGMGNRVNAFSLCFPFWHSNIGTRHGTRHKPQYPHWARTRSQAAVLRPFLHKRAFRQSWKAALHLHISHALSRILQAPSALHRFACACHMYGRSAPDPLQGTALPSHLAGVPKERPSSPQWRGRDLKS